ncbi:Cys-tRNA(Pro) deacylase [Lagierella sp.]|uniref:Cys-tRNA(Pro) deacylase n=1 Tax=Lagierella sp. TaxID=2849657 RepID=UPI00344BA881
MKKVKTNAIRILEANNVNFEYFTYDPGEDIDGISVANKLNEPTNRVFKTLVTLGREGNYVFVIPVDRELDLKKAASSVGEKKIEMLHLRDLKFITGYIRGGCSPIGMKKQFPTVVDKSATLQEYIYVSGGKIGVQLKIAPDELINLINGKFEDITK